MDLMLDFETLDVGSMPALISVGAVAFDPYVNDDFIDFERTIDAETCIKVGGSVSFSTIKWWMMQNQEARKKIYKPDTPALSIEKVLLDIRDFIKDNKIKKVWGHGANFDPVLLDNYYKALDIKVPFMYYNVRDTRTIFDLTGIKRTEITVKHNALEDARGQAIDVQRCCIGFKNLMQEVERLQAEIAEMKNNA
jgi:hypothetical protein